MINFDAQTLQAFLEENFEFLLGARIQKIQQPTRQDFIFGLRNKGESKKLYVNIHPNFFHICFMSSENEQKRFIKIPKFPPMFCMLLRKYLEGAKIAKINQPQNETFGERILEFYFEVQNEVGEKIYLCLAIELMGKHSNIILYNYDTNVIISCAHNVGAEKSREREMIGGLPYTYPPKAQKKEYLELLEYLKENGQLANSINETIDNYFADYQETENIKLVKSKLTANINAKLKKVKNSLTQLEKQSKPQDKADLYRKYGDLIMANLYGEKDFSKSIEVIDYEINSFVKVELDETKTLKENANRYYKLYTKAKNTILKTQEMTGKLIKEKNYLEQVAYSINCAENLDDLLEIQEEIGVKETVWAERQRGKEAKQNIFTLHSSPFTIYIGKNNKQNDYIVSKLAKDEDLWFHTKNCAGSHVLLKAENNTEPDEKIIFECAKLAKEHSNAKNSSKVGVIYTKRKFLKKPPGANLGYVTYKNEKEIIID